MISYSGYGTFRSLLCSVLIAILASGTSFIPASAKPSRLTSSPTCKSDDLAFISSSFELVPPRKKLKKTPSQVKIFDYDGTPLGNRAPLLLVHGLRGEFYPTFRWQKVAMSLTASRSFNQKYKIYLARYSTLHRLDGVIGNFRNEIDKLYRASRHQKITLVALSMGGNLCYESLLDPKTNSKVAALVTMGTPFHGSPLFSSNWLQYSLYKRLSLPLTRIDHSLALRLYFNRNKNLVADLGWDNLDEAVPFPGEFKSKLPFGPKGVLNEKTGVNKRLQKINVGHPEIKSKLITYATYLKNPYLEPLPMRYIEKTLMYPITLFWVKFPAHLAREHAVLTMLNHDIACVDVTESWKKKAESPFHYALNDGITPVASALFLPPKVLQDIPLSSEKGLALLRNKTDVRIARVFKDADHLTYIDGYRPLSASQKIQDELHPDEGEKEIFDWIVSDLLSLTTGQNHVAEETEPASTSYKDETEGANRLGKPPLSSLKAPSSMKNDSANLECFFRAEDFALHSLEES